jgi:hypothetical protein
MVVIDCAVRVREDGTVEAGLVVQAPARVFVVSEDGQAVVVGGRARRRGQKTEVAS